MKDNLIEKTSGYRVGQAFFPFLRDAQIESLAAFFKAATPTGAVGWAADSIADTILNNRDAIIDILSMEEEKKRVVAASNCTADRKRHRWNGDTCMFCHKNRARASKPEAFAKAAATEDA